MPFDKGPITCRRYSCAARDPFGEDDVERLRANSFDRPLEEGGVQYGWAASDHLDSDFTPEKSLSGEFMRFSFRVRQVRVDPSELKARTRVELDALLKAGQANNKKTKGEAKEAAQDALSADPKYVGFTTIPVAYDQTGAVWYGSASHAHLGMFETLFQRTFGVPLDIVTPRSVTEANPPELDHRPVWLKDGQNFDYWGNQWALWLLKEAMGGTEEFDAGTEKLTLMVAKRLAMDCPNGEKGKVVVTHMMPHTRPETVKAVSQGKLPTSIGLEMVAGGDHFKVTLSPHEMVYSGVSLPDAPDMKGPALEAERLLKLRRLFRLCDGVFDQYMRGIK